MVKVKVVVLAGFLVLVVLGCVGVVVFAFLVTAFFFFALPLLSTFLFFFTFWCSL